MQVAYFDCSSGISGDMILGALVDLGIGLNDIQKGLGRLDLKGYRLQARVVKRGMISATKVDVVIPKSRHTAHRTYPDIKKLLLDSRLPEAVKTRALGVFTRLGRAEAKVHRTRLDRVHFHEVGATDSIVDIVGGVFGLHLLAPDRIFASPLNTGEGVVECGHGVLPVPAPATLQLLQGIPCYSSGIRKELTTPTGAAMIGHLAEGFISLPEMIVLKSGHGAGSHVLEEVPNVLRIVLGEKESSKPGRMMMVETNIDDMNPEFYDHVMESLFAAGAVDVFFSPIQMKKNRPAVKVTAMCPQPMRDRIVDVLLSETSTFGVRFYEVDRVILNRQERAVETPYGKVKVKVGRRAGVILHLAPEYDECKKIARRRGLPIKAVYEEVLRCAENTIK